MSTGTIMLIPTWYRTLLAAMAVMLVVPIWAVDNPPLVDYPNHLARGYILFHQADFAEQFEIDYSSTPSLAMDLFMLTAQNFCDIRTAGKLFLSLTLCLWLGGWHLLGHAIHGKPTYMALGAALIAYHSMFLYGFTNFSICLGVYLVALAGWLYGRQHWPWPRHGLTALAALACYFTHMAAFIFLTGSMLAITAWECLRTRALPRRALIDVMPVFVPLVFILRGGSGGKGFAWNTLRGKVIGALSLFRGYDRWIDIAFIAAVLIFVMLLFLWSTRTRAVGSILFTGLGCLLTFAVGPFMIFGGAPADARFLPVAAALIFLSLDMTYTRAKAATLLTIFLALVMFRVGTTSYFWHEIDADINDQVALFAELPERAQVYPIVRVPEQPEEQKRTLPMFHAVCYAVIDRQAYVPNLLTVPGHIPMRYKTAPITFHTSTESFTSLGEVKWNDVLAHYDYIWCYRVPDDYRDFLARHGILIAAKGTGTLWRVQRTP